MFQPKDEEGNRVRGDPVPSRHVYEEYERQKRMLYATSTDPDLYTTTCREIAKQLGI